MSLIKQRVIWDDNGTLKDLSPELNDAFAQDVTLPLVAAEDKIYIGSELPFNHRYIRLGSTANGNASAVSAEIWDSNEWQSAVDVVDQTASGGASLARSGILSFSVERNQSWAQEDTTEDIPALATLKIYDLYWCRLTFSGDLTAGTVLSYIGHKFSDDDTMAAYYPDLLRSEVLAGFEAGKTDWDDQHIIAAEECVRFLRKRKAIVDSNQVLDWREFELAAIHKTAEIIYTAFGSDYEALRDKARSKFMEEMNRGIFTIDRDEDGRVDDEERTFHVGFVRT